MGLKNLTISMILIMLFVLAIIFFGVGIASDNNATRSIDDDDLIRNLRTNISSTSSSYDSQTSSGIQAYVNSTSVVGGDNPQKETEESLLSSIYKVPKVTFDLTMGFIFTRLFGGEGQGDNFKIIFIIIGAFISALFIAYIIKALRSGDI